MIVHIDLLFALRMICGLFFLPHLVLKFVFFNDTLVFFKKAGLPFPKQLIFVDAAVEAVVSTMLIANVVTWFAGGLGALHLSVAAAAVWRANGHTWRWNRGGPEYPLFWATLCVLIALGSWPGLSSIQVFAG